MYCMFVCVCVCNGGGSSVGDGRSVHSMVDQATCSW